MEAAIIKGSIAVLERFQPIILFEFELIPENIRANAESCKDFLDTLSNLDYDFFWPGTLRHFDDIANFNRLKCHNKDLHNVVALPGKRLA